VCESSARFRYFYFTAVIVGYTPTFYSPAEKQWGLVRNDRSGFKSNVLDALDCTIDLPEPVCELTLGIA
jgi:hypothetical protein